ncbi:hypothetical protein LCGC14_1808380 [marine sediment metagenome]|uniref:Uncharacterized protein n=1 Tax=marine sediment metagenome TaxID=412755 RepID=A0A0F9HAJ3_9ZZZZ
MKIDIDAVVKAFAEKLRRALESGGGIELIVKAPEVIQDYGALYCTTRRRLPEITTLVITDWTPPEPSYDELVESWLERNRQCLEREDDCEFCAADVCLEAE